MKPFHGAMPAFSSRECEFVASSGSPASLDNRASRPIAILNQCWVGKGDRWIDRRERGGVKCLLSRDPP